MAWSQKLIDKTLFSVDAYKAAIGDKKTKGYAVVRIQPEDKRVGSDSLDFEIIGIMQNEVSFSIEANWESLGGITGLLPSPMVGIADEIGGAVNKVVNLAGFADLGSVYASRKVYKKSGNLDLTIDMRIVDWEGIGMPVRAAILLSYLCLPNTTYGKENIEKGKQLGNMILESVSNAREEAQEESEDTGNGSPTPPNVAAEADNAKAITGTQSNTEGSYLPTNKKSPPLTVEGIMQGTDEALANLESKAEMFGHANTITQIKKNVFEGVSDYFLLRTAPSTVKVTIGNFFEQPDMVITNARYTFSKEMTYKGPLYVDINLAVTSRKILGGIEDLGLSTEGKGSVEWTRNATGTRNLT